MRVVDQVQDPLNQAVLDHNHTDLNLSDDVFCRLDGFMSDKIGFSISPSELSEFDGCMIFSWVFL